MATVAAAAPGGEPAAVGGQCRHGSSCWRPFCCYTHHACAQRASQLRQLAAHWSLVANEAEPFSGVADLPNGGVTVVEQHASRTLARDSGASGVCCNASTRAPDTPSFDVTLASLALNTEAIMGALGLGGAKALSSTSGAASTGTTASGTKPKQREADSALPECIVSPRGLHYLFRCHQCLWEDTEAQGSDDAKAEAQGEGLFRKGPTSGIEAVPEPMLREADSALTERIENPVSLQEKGRGGLGTLLGTVELEPAPGQLAWLCSCCRARSFDLHWERRLCFTPGAH